MYHRGGNWQGLIQSSLKWTVLLFRFHLVSCLLAGLELDQYSCNQVIVMLVLPTDILLYVFEFLDICDLCRLSKVNSKIRQISNHPKLWLNLAKKYDYFRAMSPEEKNFKTTFALFHTVLLCSQLTY